MAGKIESSGDEKGSKAAPNKHQVRSERTRLVILDAAEPLFAPSGITGASMRQVARAAGVDMSLVAYHFESKASLYDAVVDRIMAEVADRRSQMLDELLAAVPDPTPLELFDIQITAFLDLHFSGRPERARLIHHRFHQNVDAPRTLWPSDPFVRRFMGEVERACPGLSRSYVHWTYHGIVGSLIYFISSSSRIERLSGEVCNVHSRQHIRDSILDQVRKLLCE